MTKQQEPPVIDKTDYEKQESGEVEFEINLDADTPEVDESERRAKESDRREVSERRILDRVVIDKPPRRQKPDRRG